MSRIAYVNGCYVPHNQAAVHIEDRGYQFADGVYEVCEIADGYIIDMTRHLARLNRSLSELQMAWPVDKKAFVRIVKEVVIRNRVRNGLVYIQVSRGVAKRDHVFPASSVKSALVITARSSDPAQADLKTKNGVGVITVPENRWDRVDIKTVGLLPNVLAKQKAKEQGAAEAWFVDEDGMVKEGSSTNAWIVTQDGTLVTRPADHGILRGITRTTAIDAAEKLGLKVEERHFSVDEAKNAREAFITAATTILIPVVSIDGDSVANGHAGSITEQLRIQFRIEAEKTSVYR
ncbi:D-amino-acid transaminase [Ahrensia sp. 13_GOM-1096m]|uniref:D-amino-acid transaminase n=1 Tax=Ahrensia sp. 13_GOM-1096m TaxID=1380380 RepID=UPI00047B94D6|nr:D-amino-acid transaminase [Ahrensia sp. 13_GOM-1096m]